MYEGAAMQAVVRGREIKGRPLEPRRFSARRPAAGALRRGRTEIDVDRSAPRPRPRCAAPRRARRASLVLAFGLVLLPALVGCTTLRYLLQAGVGQVDLRLRARDIDQVLNDIGTELWVRRLLSQVASIKRFGEREGLTPTANYTQYAELPRPYAVWVVNACERLRFRDKTWAFPVVGSVPYLGWFHEEDAQRFAEGLRKEGWDVDVRGADAYSTLGWFKDPVLSTMLSTGREALGDLVNVILHESLHATVYFEGQTDINESLANFVADRLTVVYLDETLGPASPERAAYVAAAASGELRVRRLLEARQALSDLYASTRPARDKLVEKGRLLAAVQKELRLTRPLNNATLSQLKVYNSGAPELSALLSACGGSFPRLLQTLRTLRADVFAAERKQDFGALILPLIRAGCPTAPRSAKGS
jgi:predicted aminopeptidase